MFLSTASDQFHYFSVTGSLMIEVNRGTKWLPKSEELKKMRKEEEDYNRDQEQKYNLMD